MPTARDESSAAQELERTNHEYEALHTAKEDAFWASYMGHSEDADAARAELDRLELALRGFLQDAQRLEHLRRSAAAADADPQVSEATRVGLHGWVRTLEAHAIEGQSSQALDEEIVAAEGRLARARGSMELGYEDPKQGFQRASSVKLSTLLFTDPEEGVRRAAWEGLRSIETHVLANGFLEVVKLRNRLAREQGAEDYYDWKVRRSESMTKAEVFGLLDELEGATRETTRASLDALASREGADALKPWNLRFHTSGAVTRDLDPYFPFELALARWARSFTALGVRYRGARLVLDLVDRPGKYENGFMHGPEVAWRDAGTFRPARIHFTANAIPGLTGSGQRAVETLFHEGGHAAHFANIDMPSPCFGQEFAPTSGAWAETQSMFLDSLIEDADWRARYASDRSGNPMPFELVERGVREVQPYAAFTQRLMMAVPYGERAIYEIPEEELSAERVLSELRAAERRLSFLEAGTRPILSIPHLLEGESSAYYHDYVLALMGVQQTREHFLSRDGHLVDNPRIGPELTRSYWQAGNSRPMSAFLEDLTGNPLSAKPLARHVNRSVDEALDEARASVARLDSIPAFEGPIELEADVSVVHGTRTVGSSAGGFDALCTDFQGWIEEEAARASA